MVDQDTSRIFILSIPDYAYTPFGGGSAVISEEIDAYNNIKRRVAGEYGIAFIDITPISREGLGNTSLVTSDGLHPSRICIFNATGILVSDQVINTRSVKMDLSQIGPGIYTLWIYFENQEKISRRILLMRDSCSFKKELLSS